VVGFLKRKENQDHFDTDTNFTPFKLKVWFTAFLVASR
jgi:hypothetical protein